MYVSIYVTYKENTCDFNLQLIYTVCIARLQLANRLGAWGNVFHARSWNGPAAATVHLVVK